jgi:uncharacterized sulfatase
VLTGKTAASRTGPLFFRRPPDRDAFYGIPDLPDLAIRDGDWKLLCEYDGSDVLLFQLAEDPSEKNNVSAGHPAVVERLTRKVLAWHAKMPPDNGATYRRRR